MAFKTQNNFGETIYLGNDPKEGQQEVFEGFPVDVKVHTKGEGKKAKEYTFILCAPRDEKDVELVSLCSCAAINNVLINKGTQTLKPAFHGKLCRFTYLGHEKVEGYPQPLKKVKVELDDETQLKKFKLLPI